MDKKKYCMTCGNAMAELPSKEKTLYVCSYCGEVVHKIENRYIYGGTISIVAFSYKLRRMASSYHLGQFI